MENRKNILQGIKAKADLHKVPWTLADAIVCTESAYNPWAVRYEKNINVFQLPDKFSKLTRVSLDTEVQLQKFSYGLFQILGCTSRWMGYNGSFMQLCDIDTNITWGLRYLEHLRERYNFQDDVISAFNMGTPRRKKNGQYVNQEYVDKVVSFMSKNI